MGTYELIIQFLSDDSPTSSSSETDALNESEYWIDWNSWRNGLWRCLVYFSIDFSHLPVYEKSHSLSSLIWLRDSQKLVLSFVIVILFSLSSKTKHTQVSVRSFFFFFLFFVRSTVFRYFRKWNCFLFFWYLFYTMRRKEKKETIISHEFNRRW